jgi:hypothetical protein
MKLVRWKIIATGIMIGICAAVSKSPDECRELFRISFIFLAIAVCFEKEEKK